QPLVPEEIVCIINSRGSSVADYVRQHYPTLPITFVQQDTASSYESFTVLCEYLHDSPFLVTTVDSVFPPAFLPQFVAAARQQPGYWLPGYLAPKMIDVDRPQDIAVAEQFVREMERGSAS